MYVKIHKFPLHNRIRFNINYLTEESRVEKEIKLSGKKVEIGRFWNES